MIVKFDNREFEVNVANDFWSRFKGLMGKKEFGDGLWLKRCSSIHCMFMKVNIDVVYLDKHNIVLHKEMVKPWHIGSLVKGCASVLELQEGYSSTISLGEEMRMEG